MSHNRAIGIINRAFIGRNLTWPSPTRCQPRSSSRWLCGVFSSFFDVLFRHVLRFGLVYCVWFPVFKGRGRGCVSYFGDFLRMFHLFLTLSPPPPLSLSVCVCPCICLSLIALFVPLSPSPYFFLLVVMVKILWICMGMCSCTITNVRASLPAFIYSRVSLCLSLCV